MLGDEIELTIPGRRLLGRLIGDYQASVRFAPSLTANDYVNSMDIGTVVAMAAQEVENYQLDPSADGTDYRADDLDNTEFKVALARLVTRFSNSSFTAPQVHSGGDVKVMRSPKITNRRYPSALPRGAFWTSTIVGQSDTWALADPQDSGMVSNRCLVDFRPEKSACYVVDSAAAWNTLVSTFPSSVDGRLVPSWPNVCTQYDAVHLTLSGLLSAHPGALGDGVVGVAEWSTVSTAWLRVPDSFELRPEPRATATNKNRSG